MNEVTAKVFSILFREKKWGKMDKGEGEGGNRVGGIIGMNIAGKI